MISWRDSILKQIVPQIYPFYLISDCDLLLTEEKLSQELLNNFDVVVYEDSLEFRYFFESKYRAIWDNNKRFELIILLQNRMHQFNDMPYDILSLGKKISFDLQSIFPNLNCSIIEKLDPVFFDSLFVSQNEILTGNLGENDTKEFILHHVFGIDITTINDDVDMLVTLLRIHYNHLNIPNILIDHMIDHLKEKKYLEAWNIEKLLRDREVFFTFLQDRWQLFVNIIDNKPNETHKIHEQAMLGPSLISFEHKDIRIFMDNLFFEGYLKPIKTLALPQGRFSWTSCGIISSDKENEKVRFEGLFDLIEKSIPNQQSRYSDWLAFVLKYGELKSLFYSDNNTHNKERYCSLSQTINKIFSLWLIENFSTLITLPSINPVMLHHVSRYLTGEFEKNRERGIALLVIDGLSIDQWVLIRKILSEYDTSLLFREATVFAWIPTLTSISRQALFAGKAPYYFPSSLLSTGQEAKLWSQLWESFGLSPRNIGYMRSYNGEELTSKVVGLVIDQVDKMMHGMQLGSIGLHSQIKLWCQNKFLLSTINNLLDNNYQVWLTSDHGNIECEGIGRPSERSIADSRGERARIYSTQELLSIVTKQYPTAQIWKPHGLPPGVYPLLASSNDAFVSVGQTVVSHGGSSIEEVIVPFVKVERKA